MNLGSVISFRKDGLPIASCVVVSECCVSAGRLVLGANADASCRSVAARSNAEKLQDAGTLMFLFVCCLTLLLLSQEDRKAFALLRSVRVPKQSRASTGRTSVSISVWPKDLLTRRRDLLAQPTGASGSKKMRRGRRRKNEGQKSFVQL